MKTVLIKEALLIDPSQNIEKECDLLVEDGVIKDLAESSSINIKADKVIEAKGKWVLPGLIDLHVHLREPGFEWKETIKTGVSAAIKGGYTSICSMPNTKPVNDSAEITRFILEQACKAGLSRVLPIGSVSVGLQGKELSPLSELMHSGCVAFSDDGEPIWDSLLMKRALEWCEMFDGVICCHEEDKCLSCSGSMNESGLSTKLGLEGMSTLAEDVMVARDIEIARATGGRVHICHISSARGVELVRRAKNDGIRITAEVTPHHLIFSEKECSTYDTNFKMSPPLRTEKEIEGLIEGVKDGTIDAIASDHAPHEADSKEREFSEATMGILGLQTSLPVALKLVRDGVLTRSRAVEVMTSGPAKCFNLEFGTLQKGKPADICILDPEKEWIFDKNNIESKSKNSPFVGMNFKGMVETVLVNGKICLENSEIIEHD